jgi:hypothetical protein
MARADHIYVERDKFGVFAYTHHGIDCGNGTVIEYSEDCIRRIPIAEFSQGKTIYQEQYDYCDSPNIVIQRAESRLGERKYNLVFNNCEHFATWCKTGKEKYGQVKFVRELLDFYAWRLPEIERQYYDNLIEHNNYVIRQLDQQLQHSKAERQHYSNLIEHNNYVIKQFNQQLQHKNEKNYKTLQDNNLVTDKFDYRILQSLLQEECWQEADELTSYAMLKIAGREYERYFRLIDIYNFPREHLAIIDKLWRDCSKNLFGFSIQKAIYSELGSNQNYQYEIWDKFSKQVGWRIHDIPLPYQRLSFSKNAPKGHLPHGKRIGFEVIGFINII